MEIITAWLIQYGLMAAGGTIAAAVLGWVLAKIPTGKWSKQSAIKGAEHGKIVTAFCSKKIPLWNNVIEPIFVDTVGVLLSYISGFIVGLKSDN